MENIQKSNAFLDLLKEENLSKINIDKELIPVFKIVVLKINDYFLKNNLMDVKDWNDFFKKYLITNNSEQIQIKLGRISENTEPVGGEYSKEKKLIAITQRTGDINTLCSSFCHEFIHFLVMHDSNTLKARLSDSAFFNEGMTEYLTSCITDKGNSSAYFREYEMAKFYCKITKNTFAYFLNDKFAFSDDCYAPTNLIRNSDRFLNWYTLESFLSIQREIIKNGLNDYNINSFEDFVNIVTIINQRPRFDGEYIDFIFEKIVNKYVEKLDLNEEQEIDIKDKLTFFCKVSNRYQLYGDNEVAEYLFDDLNIAFDKKGKMYNDFPLDGAKKRGQVQFDGNNTITVIHADNTYKINIDKMNCKNWKEIYDKTYTDLKNEIDLLNMHVMENSESKSGLKK